MTEMLAAELYNLESVSESESESEDSGNGKNVSSWAEKRLAYERAARAHTALYNNRAAKLGVSLSLTRTTSGRRSWGCH